MAGEAETHWTRGYARDFHLQPADHTAALGAFEREHGRAPTHADDAELRRLAGDYAQNRFNDAIENAVRLHPGTDPHVLKSLLVQESSLNPDPGGRGFRGIAQLGEDEARSQGLTVAGRIDERLDPAKAIPAAAGELKTKEAELANAFRRYGRPLGDELQKFTLAAYNGGSGTVAMAMRLTHDRALEEAHRNGMTGPQAETAARNAATHFDNLTEPRTAVEQSPLYRAADHYLTHFGSDPHEKYREISHYADDIMARARQGDRGRAVSEPAAPQPHVRHISGEIIEGRRMETAAELAMKNRIIDLAVTDARHGKIDDINFVGNGRESAAEVAAQNALLRRDMRENLSGAQPVPPPAAHTSAAGGHDRSAVAREFGGHVNNRSDLSDVRDPQLTARSTVDALGRLHDNLRGTDLLPQITAINSDHHDDGPRGHRGGHAVDMALTEAQDTPANRERLIRSLATDPYITKVGLAFDYNTAANRRILEHAGVEVFTDSGTGAHIHVQSNLAPGHTQALERREHQANEVRTAVETYNRAHGPRMALRAPTDDQVKPWDHRAVGGTMLEIDKTTYALHIGRGEYRLLDITRDLNGTKPPIDQPVQINRTGNVTPHTPMVEHHR